MPSRRPEPIVDRKSAEAEAFHDIGEDLQYQNAMPLAKLCMPRVTMKGAILSFATMRPFTRPMTRQMPTVSSTASASGILLAKLAQNTPATATCEPTLRSIPPDRMTANMPMLTTMIVVCWTIMFTKFRPEKNAGDIIDATTIIRANTLSGMACILR